MAKSNFSELFNKINKYESFVILTHHFPDPDALGSSFAMGSVIKNYKKDANINVDVIFPTEYPLKFPQCSFNKKPFLLIICDVHNKSRIVNFDKYYNQSDCVFVLDHHPGIPDFECNYIINQNIIATCELIAPPCYKYINKDSALGLYIGIHCDSGGFLYDKVTPETFLCGKTLLEKGADLKKAEEYINLFDIKDLEMYKILSSKFYLEKKIGICIITEKDYDKYKFDFINAKKGINILRKINNINILVYGLYNIEKKQFFISLRSRHFNVRKIAQKFNGGGHILAAGIKCKNLEDIKNIIHECQNAAQIAIS